MLRQPVGGVRVSKCQGELYEGGCGRFCQNWVDGTFSLFLLRCRKKKWCKKHPKSEISKCPPWPLPCPSAVSTSPMQPLLHTLRRQGHVPWLGGQIQSCWVFVCRWLPHDAGALTIPVYCPSKAWQMRVDDAIGFHRSQSLKVLQNITQDQWLTVLMSLLTSRSCGQVAFHSVGPLFKAALDSPKHKSHQDKRVLTRIGNRKIWDQVLSKGPA